MTKDHIEKKFTCASHILEKVSFFPLQELRRASRLRSALPRDAAPGRGSADAGQKHAVVPIWPPCAAL